MKPCFASIDGVLFRKDDNTLVAYPAGKQDTAYSIPDGTASIGAFAFHHCKSLTGITIPDSVTVIGECAFMGCPLRNIIIPDSVTSIGRKAFYECEHLTEITIPDSVTSIGEDAFGFEYGKSEATFTVTKGSYAEQYAKDNGYQYTY